MAVVETPVPVMHASENILGMLIVYKMCKQLQMK